MSENCFIMPFRFTIMTAARTAWDRRNIIRVRHPDMTHPDWPELGQSSAYNYQHTNLIPLALIRTFDL